MREGFSGGLVEGVVPIMSMNLAWPRGEGVVRGFVIWEWREGEGEGERERGRETDLD